MNDRINLFRQRRDTILTLHRGSDRRDLKMSIYESSFNLNHWLNQIDTSSGRGLICL